MADEQAKHTQESYDTVAEEYDQRLSNELDHKPLERDLLDRFVAKVNGRICDLGCGTGHVTRYLHGRNADVFGIDLSPRMVTLAQQRSPGIHFEQGDMRDLKLDDNSLGGILLLYSIIHIPRDEVTGVLRGLRRVLQPGGLLLIGFHKGQEILHQAEWWGKAVNLDIYFFEPDEMRRYLHDAGFEVTEVIERAPYPDVEYQSHRAYVWATKAQ